MFDVKQRQKDNVFVIVVTSIQYQALSDKAADAFYKLSNTRAQIQSYVFDGMDVQLDLEVESHHAKSAYGFEIVQMVIVDTKPDKHVKRTMSEINAAARMKVVANEKAEAEKILQIKHAKGD
uniref:Uncharacterized protein n=1 Tax=Quercus lobata TaxID=97700 RepID=A0A7N2LJ89_QUELO